MNSIEKENLPVSRDNIGAASCLTTILALPLMLGIFLLLEYLAAPTSIGFSEIAPFILGLPLMLLASMFGVLIWPWSSGVALILTFFSALFITRRRGGTSWRSPWPWLLLGLLSGVVTASTMLSEPHPINGGYDVVILLLSGALTGMAAGIICRHLVRSFEG